jgi:hypothetical protein
MENEIFKFDWGVFWAVLAALAVRGLFNDIYAGLSKMRSGNGK